MQGTRVAVGYGHRAWLSYLPGLLVWLGLYIAIIRNGGRFLYEERFSIMQSLDPNALAEQFWPSLLSLHIQPPLLNAMYGVTDGPEAPRNLGLVFALASLLTILMVVHTVRLAGLGSRWAAVSGLLYALLPGTVLYSLFPYSTTIVAFFMMACIWGVALAKSHPSLGVTMSALGATGLFLTRASFLWAFVLVWLVALGVLFARVRSHDRRTGMIVVLASCAAAVIVVQGHYFISFGTPTLSSWSGQNLYGAVSEVGLSPETRADLSAEDPCFAELIAVGPWQPPSSYPTCVGAGAEPIGGTLALDEAAKVSPGVGINFNNGSLLLLSKQWSALSMAAVMQEPSAEWGLIAGEDGKDGSLALFLGRSDVYYETLDLQKTFAPWLWSLLGVWSWIFPKLAWAILLLALIRATVDRRARQQLPTVFWFASGLLLFHAAVSIAAEIGENQRFRAEADPVLVVAMLLAGASLLTWRRREVACADAADLPARHEDARDSGALGVSGLPGT